MAVDYSGHLRRETHVFDIPTHFFKVLKALRKSLTKGAYLSSDSAVFRGVAKLADKSLDGKDKAGDYLALFLSLGILIEDQDEKRYYFDEERAESLKEEAGRRNQLSRLLGDPIKRLAALKLAFGNNKSPEREPKGADAELAELYAADNEELKLEIRRLEGQVIKLSERVVTHEDATELARLRAENTKLECRRREAEGRHGEAVAEHAKANAQITDLNLKLKLAEAGREDYKAEVARVQRKLNEANQARDAALQELRTTNSEAGAPKQKLEEAEARANQATTELAACQRRLNDVTAQISSLFSEQALREERITELENACRAATEKVLSDLKLMTDRLSQAVGNTSGVSCEADDSLSELRVEAEKRLEPLNKRYRAVEDRFLGLSGRISDVEDNLRNLTGADPDLIAAHIKKSDPRVPELLEARLSLIDESDRTRSELEPLGRSTRKLREFLAHLDVVEKGIPETEDLSVASAEAVEMLKAKRVLSPDELAQEHGLPYNIIRLITLYEMVKPVDRRSRYSVLRIVNIAIESGIVEEKDSQPLLASCHGLRNEEKATFDRLLSTRPLPKNGLTTCIRTLESLPWLVSEVFDTKVVKDFCEAFYENIEQQSPSH